MALKLCLGMPFILLRKIPLKESDYILLILICKQFDASRRYRHSKTEFGNEKRNPIFPKNRISKWYGNWSETALGIPLIASCSEK
jgi:hypothetical protein